MAAGATRNKYRGRGTQAGNIRHAPVISMAAGVVYGVCHLEKNLRARHGLLLARAWRRYQGQLGKSSTTAASPSRRPRLIAHQHAAAMLLACLQIMLMYARQKLNGSEAAVHRRAAALRRFAEIWRNLLGGIVAIEAAMPGERPGGSKALARVGSGTCRASKALFGWRVKLACGGAARA